MATLIDHASMTPLGDKPHSEQYPVRRQPCHAGVRRVENTIPQRNWQPVRGRPERTSKEHPGRRIAKNIPEGCRENSPGWSPPEEHGIVGNSTTIIPKPWKSGRTGSQPSLQRENRLLLLS